MYRRLYLSLILLFGTLFQIVSNTTYNCSTSASCGCSVNSAVVTKIVGGEQASARTWGWAVSLRSSLNGAHFCGGSIINSSHILTAAHCTVDLLPSSIRVYVGSIYLTQAGQVREVSKIYNHPSYSKKTFLNDIAILKLSSPLNLNQTDVDRVCLPNVSSTIATNGGYPTVGVNLVAIGWGLLEEDALSVPSILQQVTIRSIAIINNYCQRTRISDSSTQFCAGVMPDGGKDTCQGDSGGPLLMFTSNNVWEQVGITSVGVGCAKPLYPGIYTRVAAYQSWISATVNSANREFFILYTIFTPLILFIIL